jgi:hypothetical protein
MQMKNDCRESLGSGIAGFAGGPEQLEVLHMAKRICGAGEALTVMGSREFKFARLEQAGWECRLPAASQRQE